MALMAGDDRRARSTRVRNWALFLVLLALAALFYAITIVKILGS
jgi:hypothetical protein